MKILANELLEDLEVLNAVTPDKIVQHSDSVYFSGTQMVTFNGEICLQKKIETEFTGAVNCKTLTAIVNKNGTREIDFIRPENSGILVRYKKSSTVLGTEDSYEPPTIKRPDKAEWKTLPKDFIKNIRSVSGVTSSKSVEPVKTSIHIKDSRVEAGDGFRIMIIESDETMSDEIFIRCDHIKVLEKLEPSSYSVSKDWIHFKNGKGFLLSLRKLNITYPDLKEIFENNNGGDSLTITDDVISSLEQASIIMDQTSETTDCVTVEIMNKNIKISVQSKSGKFRNVIPINSDIETKFLINPKFLIDMLLNDNHFKVSERALTMESKNIRYLVCLISAGE
jgi:DNA polymerase III sliding clamp (beta) subunit (PCNA family)